MIDERLALNKIPLNKLPSEVMAIFNIFEENVRLVGGAVRDLIINYPINDYDFACILSPEQIIQTLKHHNIQAVTTAIKYGTITAIIDKFHMQITTLRIDNNYAGRHCAVQFTDDYYADASRRDFTINALYLDHHGTIYDYFDGVKDLKNRCLRFIGNPTTRIAEDYLRILRFFRFSCYYANDFDDAGLASCLKNLDSLDKLSKERVREEFCKILACPNINNVVRAFKIFEHHQIDQKLWQNKIDVEAYENISKLASIQPISELAKITTLFFNKDFLLQKFFENFKCPNAEKKYLTKFTNYVVDLGIDLQLIKKTNQLLAFENKQLVIDYYLISFSKNYLDITQNDLEIIINNIINSHIPEFIIKIADLENISCPKHQLSKLYKILKIKWAEKNFAISYDALIAEAQKILLTNNL